jgi:glycosyltransferase involved in cell wall biosynthesis
MAVAHTANGTPARPFDVRYPHLSQGAARASVSVVIPAKNEAGNLPWVLPRIPDLVDEVILVDGLSTDETVAVGRMVRSDLVVIHESLPGKGAALRAGFAAASGDLIVMLDGDCSMDPVEIPVFVEALEQGYDMVKGSRFLDGGGTADMTLLRKAGNYGLLTLANTLYNSAYTDLCYGFVGFRRSMLEYVPLDADGFEVEMQFIARATRAGARIREVPSFESRRLHGQSNLRTFPDGWQVLKTLLRELRWSTPELVTTELDPGA